MSNSTTYTINFQANYNSLKNLQQELNKIAGGSIPLKLNAKESLANLQSSLESLMKDLNKKMQSGEISVGEFKQISGVYKQLIKDAEKFKREIISTSVPKEFTKQLETIQKQIDKTKASIEVTKQALKDSSQGYAIDKKGKVTARASTKNNAMKVVKQEYTGAPLPKDINTFKQLEEAYQRILKITGELTPQQKAIKDIYEQTGQVVQEAEKKKQAALQPTIDKLNEQQKEVEELKKQYAQTEQSGIAASQIPKSVTDTTNVLSNISTEMRTGLTQSYQDVANLQKKVIVTTDKTNQAFDGQKTTLGKAAHNVFTYGTALTVLRTIYNQLISTIRDMDKSLTSMTVVTNLTREQAWDMVGTLQQLGKETGMVTTQIADMTTKYLQQGKTIEDALILTEAAAKAATIAGIDGARSVELLTNAVNGFQVAAKDAMKVSDKFAALAASAATDYEGLATALSKVAAQANLAGMSMDFTLGMLTKGIEVTQEAPETIGTALKTVIARMRELTDYGETLEEGMDVNRVDTALKNVGVSLLDSNREFRNLDDVLTDLGTKWDTLTRNQQANVAVALAGTRQQSRLIAMMQDFDRTLQLVQISENAAGTTAAQHRKYMEGLEAATNRLTTSYQGLITTFANSDIVINVMNGISTSLEWLSDNTWALGLALAAVGVIMIPIIALNIEAANKQSLLSFAKLHNIETTIKLTQADKQQAIAQKLNITLSTQATAKERLLAIAKAANAEATEEMTEAEIQKNIATKMGFALSTDASAAEFTEALATHFGIEATREATREEILNQVAKQTGIGISGESAVAEGAEATATGVNTAATKLEGKAKKQTIIQKLAGAAATKLETKGLKDNALVTFLNTFAQYGLRAALKTLVPAFTGATAGAKGFGAALNSMGKSNIIGLIITLVAILIAVMSETGQLKKLIQSLMPLVESLGGVLNGLFDALKPILNVVMQVFVVIGDLLIFIIDFLMIFISVGLAEVQFIIQGITWLIEQLAKGIKALFDWLIGLIDGIDTSKLDEISAAVKTLPKLISFLFKDAKGKIEELNEAIGENQELIYEYKNYSSSVESLADEYEKLSKKTNKTTEDMERLAAIETELAELNSEDESFKNLKGQALVNASLAKAEKQKADAIALTKENYGKLTQAAKTAEKALFESNREEARAALSTQEYKAALADMIELDIQGWVESLGEEAHLTTSELSNIKNSISSIVQSTDLTKFTATEIENFKNGIREAVTQIEDLTPSMTDGVNDLEEQVRNYAIVWNNANDKVREALALQYNYLELMKQLNLDRKQYNAMEKLGLSPEDLNSIKIAYEAAGGVNFDQIMKDILSKNGDELIQAFATFGHDNGKELGIAFYEQLREATGTAEDFIEDWKQKNSRITSIVDIQTKYHNGEMSAYDLVEQQKALGLSAQEMNAIINNNYDRFEQEKEINEELRTQLETELAEIRAGYLRNDLTEEQKEALKEEEQYTLFLLDNLKYQNTYALEIYKTAQKQTQAEKDRLETQGKIAEIKEKIEKSDKLDLDLVKDLTMQYQKQADAAKELINNEAWQKALNSGAVSVTVDGEFIYDADAFKNLDSATQLWLNEHSEEVKDAYKDLESDYEEYVSYIEQVLNEEIESEKEALEKRKEMYEKYWEIADAQQEEREREQSRESILSQLQALSGGSDSATNAKRKELLAELEDINKEQAEAQKQAQRDAMLKNIDDQIGQLESQTKLLEDIGDHEKNIDDYLNALSNSGFTLTQNLSSSSGTGVEYTGKIAGYSKGGLVNYTGLAMVHGSPSEPEAFLNSAQTELLSKLTKSLMLSTTPQVDGVESNNFVIENITIQPQQLNNNQDWKSAGTTLAEEFKQAIRNRGIPVNAKR